LRTVVAINKARRARLAAIARDRLGYQEYLELRDALDKNISGLYTKLQKKDGPKSHKKKKKPSELGGTSGLLNGSALPPPSPAALGLIQDDELHLSIPDQLKQLIQTRRQWVDTVGAVFDQKERENPGRIYGLPKTSVYEGIEDEIRQELERLGPPLRPGQSPASTNGAGPPRTNGAGKGKARVRVDETAMELG
jgi:transcriptional adapter 3